MTDTFKVHKINSPLPSTLEPNAIYFVKSGDSMDVYATDRLGIASYTSNKLEFFVIPLGYPDLDANLTTDVKLLGEYFPFNFSIQTIVLSLTTAPTGSNFIVDIKKNGVSIFNTLLSVDAGEKTSLTATTPYVLNTNTINQGDALSFSVTQVGATVRGQYPVIVMSGVRI